MRIELQRADLHELKYESDGPEPKYRVALRSGQQVSAVVDQQPNKLELSQLAAAQLVFDALHLLFGSVLIQAAQSFELTVLRGQLMSSVAQLELALSASAAATPALTVTIDQIAVAGDTRLTNVVLQVTSDGGKLTAERLEVHGFKAGLTGLDFGASELRAQGFELGWGAELRILAERLELPEAKLALSGTQVTLRGGELGAVAVRGARVDVGSVKVASTQLRLDLAGDGKDSENTSEAAGPASEGKKLFDLTLLDGLSGALSVDAHVDVTIPIFGTRHGKHKLRLTVQEGTVDYRELEADLAPLENALLDFSLRGNDLVLERGIPLLPTRGFGKPILRWPLNDRDRQLAEERRVRLSVLPRFEPAGGPKDESEDEGPSAVALRRLALTNIDLDLSLHPVAVDGVALRGLTISELHAEGSVQHPVSPGSDEGVVSGTMRGLALGVDGLRLGSHTLAVHTVQVATVPRWLVRFDGLTPRAAELTLDGLYLQQLSFS